LSHVECAEYGRDQARAQQHGQEHGAGAVDALSLPAAVGIGRSAGTEGLGDADDDALGAGGNDRRFADRGADYLGRAHCKKTINPLRLLVHGEVLAVSP
jgi:hypothetical protein